MGGKRYFYASILNLEGGDQACEGGLLLIIRLFKRLLDSALIFGKQVFIVGDHAFQVSDGLVYQCPLPLYLLSRFFQ